MGKKLTHTCILRVITVLSIHVSDLIPSTPGMTAIVVSLGKLRLGNA